jgi:HIRAN domain-containing protein
MRTRIVGVIEGNRQKHISNLKGGDELRLVREPDNDYNPNAIKVMDGTKHLGYLKIELSEKLASRMDGGRWVLVAHVLDVTGGDSGKNYVCDIEINEVDTGVDKPAEVNNDPYPGWVLHLIIFVGFILFLLMKSCFDT